MSYIRTLSNGKYRAEISKNYASIQSKTFSSQKQAEKWADSVEENIEIILSLKPKKLKKLSPDKVEEMGGLVLFQKLGVEIEFLTFKSLANEYMHQWTGKDEQIEIINEVNKQFSVIDKQEKDIEENLLRTQALCQSILKKAFSGQLVPQDPNDEPASELLKRIAAEKVELQFKIN